MPKPDLEKFFLRGAVKRKITKKYILILKPKNLFSRARGSGDALAQNAWGGSGGTAMI